VEKTVADERWSWHYREGLEVFLISLRRILEG
jgi:hypothetical protein